MLMTCSITVSHIGLVLRLLNYDVVEARHICCIFDSMIFQLP